MSEKYTKSVIEKTPEQKAAQIKRIRDKLIERANRIDNEYGVANPVEAGYVVKDGGSTVLYNRYVSGANGGMISGEIKDVARQKIQLNREASFYDDVDQESGKTNKYNLEVISGEHGTEAEVIMTSGAGRRQSEEVFQDYRFNHNRVRESSDFQSQTAAEDIGTTRSAAARVLSDLRDVLAKREAGEKAQRAKRNDLTRRAIR